MDNKKIGTISVILVIALSTMAPLTSAQAIPHGIKGTVYMSDGVTPAPRGTHFSVNDTTSGYYIEGTTGGPSLPGDPFRGYYSVSIMGEDGDEVIIKAWNATHYGITVVTLVGDMEGIDVIINIPLPDTTPPASISNLDEIDKGTTWILWNWTNPPDPDFNYTEVWINGEFKDKVTTPEHSYNATGLNPDTTYEIGTRTVDNSGNVNQTWVNDTATTLSLLIHDINVSTDYAPETNGIKIKYDGTEIPASENLTIGNTYNIYYKIMNEGDYNETVGVTVKIVNSTWHQTIATHTWSIKVGKYHYAPSGGDSWDTSGLTPGNYNLTVNASIPIDDDW